MHSPFNDFRHPLVTFDARRFMGIRLSMRHRHPGHISDEVLQNDLFNTCLAKRRQYAFDVTQKYAVRTNHQNPLILKRKTIRVQQVSSPVQRHDSFTGARSTLNNEYSTLRRTNNFILLSLNRGHNIAELP